MNNNQLELAKSEVKPVKVIKKAEGHYFIDFGKAFFGTVKLKRKIFSKNTALKIILGEKLQDKDTINKTPPGTIRCRECTMNISNNNIWQILKIKPEKRNTGPLAIKMPLSIGEVLPFRYCEIKNVVSDFSVNDIRQIAVHAPFNDNASAFTSSNSILNQVYDLCKHTIKATTFCGIYVDGDRERIPYEADAYINQISHFCLDANYTVARHTIKYLLVNPTWPTEWILHCVPMVWSYYEFSGDTNFVEKHYDMLCAKTLSVLAREDGLISTLDGALTDDVMDSVGYEQKLRDFFKTSISDIVDWPPGSFTENGTGERDNHEMLAYNIVVNAFYYRNLVLMARIASALGRDKEIFRWSAKIKQVFSAFNQCFFDNSRGIYRDGEGGEHASLHANMFPLAFDLVPESYRKSVVEFVKSRGMVCSVYGAQYLLEALYKSGEADYALSLMNTKTDRGWWNMINAGSTMTWEAWDLKYKNNLDWNHAWATAPTNIITRYLMGIQIITPGGKEISIKPQLAGLESANIKYPTLNGTIHLNIQQTSTEYKMDIIIPKCIKVRIGFPVNLHKKVILSVNGITQVGIKNKTFTI